MSKTKKPITEYTECPHCGSSLGYYNKFRYKGSSHDNRLFGTNEPYNTEMWDGCTNTWEGKTFYCIECNKAITKQK